MSAGPRPATATLPRTDPSVPTGLPCTPVTVVDMDLALPYEFHRPGDRGPVHPEGSVLALVRLHGHPLGLVPATSGRAVRGAEGPGKLWQSVAGIACRRFATAIARHLAADGGPGRPATTQAGHHPATRSSAPPAPLPCQAARLRMLDTAPLISVVVATHNRPELLRPCLSSLLRMQYPRFEVIVVDNAPADDTTERLVREEFGPAVRYVREPTAGLARAHNRGLAAAQGRIAAFTDDDTLVDPSWLSALAETFAQDREIACVTGLIVPAELRTAAQLALEHHGGYAKGYTLRAWSLRAGSDDPLFPFTAGRFGSGTNMAFRVDRLRALGGFDPATGTGTPAHGGDDLLAFFRILATGRTLAYQPDAIVWHHHHRSTEALDRQAFGYGAGLGAYLTGALFHEPRMLPALLRKLPRGIAHAVSHARGRIGADIGADETGWSRNLTLLELRGLLYGPVGYLRARRLDRRTDGRPTQGTEG